jgi:hypothetical protein
MTNSIGMESGILAISLPGRGIIGKELYKILMDIQPKHHFYYC